MTSSQSDAEVAIFQVNKRVKGLISQSEEKVISQSEEKEESNIDLEETNADLETKVACDKEIKQEIDKGYDEF